MHMSKKGPNIFGFLKLEWKTLGWKSQRKAHNRKETKLAKKEAKLENAIERKTTQANSNYRDYFL